MLEASVYRFVLRKQGFKLLLFLFDGETNIRRLSKRAKVSYNHVRKILDAFIRDDLVSKTRDTMPFKILLTEKGILFAESLKTVRSALEKMEG